MSSESSYFLTVLVYGILLCLDVSSPTTELQVCHRCEGIVQNGTNVGNFCHSFSGQIDGRCCLRIDNKSDSIVGLDLSNCSLDLVENLQEGATAIIIDISNNPILNLNDSVFQGFTQLTSLILPSNLACPGGNASWETVEVKGNVRHCEGQKDFCNQTTSLAWNCPENSFCTPYGPGFFECSCIDNFHGYKCLREGQFPMIEVFGALGASTVVVSAMLWVSQRRKAKSV